MLIFILHNNLTNYDLILLSMFMMYIYFLHCTVKIWFLTMFRSVYIKKTNLHFIFYLLLFLKF